MGNDLTQWHSLLQIGLSFDFIDDGNQAVVGSRSSNAGESWSEPIPLIVVTDLTG